jgi:hypothetical protein
MRLYEVGRSPIWESEVQRAFRIVAVMCPEWSAAERERSVVRSEAEKVEFEFRQARSATQ